MNPGPNKRYCPTCGVPRLVWTVRLTGTATDMNAVIKCVVCGGTHHIGDGNKMVKEAS